MNLQGLNKQQSGKPPKKARREYSHANSPEPLWKKILEGFKDPMIMDSARRWSSKWCCASWARRTGMSRSAF